MQGRGNRGGTGSPSGERPASVDSTSSAAPDATLEGELLGDVQKETEEKTGARDHAQGTSSSAPPSPSKVPGVAKNSAPPSPSKVPGVGNNSAPSSSPPSPSKLLGVGNNSAPSSPRSAARTLREHNTDETTPEQQPVAHTRSEFAAADTQGPQAAFAETEQAMTGLLDPSHKKVEPPKLRRDFSVESVASTDVETPKLRRDLDSKCASVDNINCALLEEIEAINRTLIDAEITIAGDSGTNRITSSCDGTTIKLSYTAVAISSDLRSLFASYEMCVVTPVKLYVPPDYPGRSPTLIIDKADDQLRNKYSTISDSVDMEFPLALSKLPEPHSIKDIAKAWKTSVRSAVTKFAQQYGGGTLSSKFPWERSVGS